MKPLFIKLLFIFIATSVWAATKGVTPSTVVVGETAKVYLNADGALPTGYDIRFSLNTSTNVVTMNGGQQNWYYNIPAVSGNEGTYTVHYYLYQNNALSQDLGTSSFTINSAPPTFNSGVAISDISGGFSLGWNTATGNVMYYELYRSTSNGSLGSKIYSGTSKSYSDTSLINGTTYYYTAKACNDGGCTQGTQDYKQYVIATPIFNSGVAISDISGGFSLGWNTATGNVMYYELYRSTSNGSLGSKIYSGTSKSYSDTSLINGTTYYYTAKACNDGGCTQGTQDYKLYSLPVPIITSTNATPSTITAGENVKITANLSGALPSGYSVKREFYDNGWNISGTMSAQSSTVYYTNDVITKAGNPRQYRVAIFNGSTQVTSWQTGTFVVNELASNSKPVLSSPSAPASANINQSISLRVTATDPDNNLGTVQVNWGDNGSTAELCSKYSGDVFQCTHTYTSSGNYTWSVTAYDNGSPVLSSNTLSASVAISSNVPIITSTNATPSTITAGENVKITANLSGALPSGYSVKREFYDNGWNISGTMSAQSSTVYYTNDVITKAGNPRQYRVAIFNGSTQVTSWQTGTFVVNELASNSKPVLSSPSAPASANINQSISLRVTATDPDNNLGTVQVNWGDNGSTAELCSKYSGDVFQCTHTYTSSGNYTWSVTAYDNGSPVLSSNTLVGTTTIIENTLDSFLTFLSQDSLIAEMKLSENLNNGLSRSDSVVLIDRMRILENNNINKDMSAYLNPFADVPDNAEYTESLLHLAYYYSTSFSGTPINKYNELFNPLRHMSREEFIAVVMTSFNIPQQSYDLANEFSDTADISTWAVKYFETAVYYGIINGNNGQLLPKDSISIQEALWILEAVKKVFETNYTFEVDSFESIDSLDISTIFRKTLGNSYEPSTYNLSATPITISNVSITPNANANYIVLQVNSTVDSANGAVEYYWWETNEGYFKKSPNSTNYKEVYFYPTSSKPLSDYEITVHGADNIGFVADYSLSISKDSTNFVYPEDTKTVMSQEVIASNELDFSYEQTLTATKGTLFDFSQTTISKSNIALGLEHVVVSFDDTNGTRVLFSGTPTDNKVSFIMPDIPSLYGQDISLNVTATTQNVKYDKSISVRYLPVYTIKGQVFNSGEGLDAKYVMIDNKNVYLDENNQFNVEIDSTNINGINVSVYSASSENEFVSQFVNLSYDTPKLYMSFVGTNSIKDSDSDGIIDMEDDLPYDSSETIDTDHDGIGNNSDTDDDNDGLDDIYEITNGLNHLDYSDAMGDLDGDGVSNLEEYTNGTGVNDPASYTTTVSLQQGWNMIAIPMQARFSIASLNNNDIEIIRSYQNGEWHVWTNTNQTSTEKALTELSDGYGYWIKATNTTSIPVSGKELASSPALKSDGKWHMAGSSKVENMTNFFISHPTITVVWTYQNGQWQSKANTQDIQDTMLDKNLTELYELLPDQGFMYK